MQKQEHIDQAAEQASRIISRELARELTTEELETISGGTTSCSGGRGDDCDRVQN